MTASCVPITAARLASITSSQWSRKVSGSSATPSRDSNSYTTTLRTRYLLEPLSAKHSGAGRPHLDVGVAHGEGRRRRGQRVLEDADDDAPRAVRAVGDPDQLLAVTVQPDRLS